MRSGRPGGWTGTFALVCGLVSLAFASGGAGLATMQLVPPRIGFYLFLAAVPAAALGLLPGLFALFRARGGRNPSARRRARGGIALGTLTVAAMAGLALPSVGAPLINDITTDLVDPPAFVAAAALEANNGRDMAYPERFAAEQRRGYDLQSLDLNLPPHEAFERARRAVASLPSTRVIDSDPAAGRIEAVATSRVFYFEDDIIVRVRPTKIGSRIDVRSKSRDGRGDMGVNARRIEHLFAILH